ncbi:hypothetical protein [Roseibium sp.]|uniref:hypothetical protein n=1 Tax=Roseibium sp. TaxID=1936156 RepID=UPI003B522E19
MTISYARQQTLQGLDSSVTPNWQMVPVGAQRTLAVSGHGSLVPRVNPSNIANVALNNSGGSARPVITDVPPEKGTSSGCLIWTIPARLQRPTSLKHQSKLNGVFRSHVIM